MGETTTVQKDVPYFDVSAANDGGRVTICVVNRHEGNTIATPVLSQEGRCAGLT